MYWFCFGCISRRYRNLHETLAHHSDSVVTATTPAVAVESLTLDYRLPRFRANSLKELAVRVIKRRSGYDSIRALSEVTFSVWPGEVFGVVGPNGAGKSSLMKVLARILPPTSGRVRVVGQVSAMIELGAGFNAEQTARENILLYGALLGRDVALMRERCNPILEWAELRDYRDVPLHAFSSGMLARLGFAVAVDVAPRVLIVDEVLSVGDESFQRRSTARMDDLIEQGTSVVLVSHNLAQLRQRAHRAMWLDRGRVRALGATNSVVEAYLESTGLIR
ncbi:MAG: ABC transporter ATP-binding protein [Actinomycetota bacterium]|nr:ABC transporter ATP-binding protein [Actinomycetota bacterium]